MSRSLGGGTRKLDRRAIFGKLDQVLSTHRSPRGSEGKKRLSRSSLDGIGGLLGSPRDDESVLDSPPNPFTTSGTESFPPPPSGEGREAPSPAAKREKTVAEIMKEAQAQMADIRGQAVGRSGSGERGRAKEKSREKRSRSRSRDREVEEVGVPTNLREAVERSVKKYARRKRLMAPSEIVDTKFELAVWSMVESIMAQFGRSESFPLSQEARTRIKKFVFKYMRVKFDV